MCNYHLAFIVALYAALSTVYSSAPDVGKCKTENIVPVPLNVSELQKDLKWKILYATDFDSVEDHESYVVTLLGGNNYEAVDKKVLKNKSQSETRSRMRLVDNVVIQDVVDDNGKLHRFYMYPLQVTKSHAVLYYRCSESGDPNIDYRLIGMPEGHTPNEEDIKNLLAFDKAIFGEDRGTLIKLPENLHDD